MPTISINPKDFIELLGYEMDEKTLEEQIDLAKAEFKGTDEDGCWRVELNDTNRPDLWSAEGIARQVRMVAGRRRDYPFFSGDPEGEIKVAKDLETVRPFVAAFIVKGLSVTDASLAQIIQTQEKLADNFGRRRKEVAIGVYNLDKITFPIHYKAVAPNEHSYIPLGMEESLTLADILERHPKGIEYREILAGKKKVPLLVDDAGMTLSMPPIINSREVGEVVPGDSDLFVEATGENLVNVILALNIMACDMADRGGRISRVRTNFAYETSLGKTFETPFRLDKKLSIPVDEFGRLLGVKVTANEISNMLERYGCDVSVEGEMVHVQPPPTRMDYLHMVDVVEDFAIARGYGTFSPVLPREFTLGTSDALSMIDDKVRDQMVGMEYEEFISNMLVSKAQLTEKMNMATKSVVEVDNLMNENYAVIRDSILPSLLQAEANSTRAAYPHRLFETGDVAVFDKSAAHGSRTEIHLGAMIAHREVTLSEIHADLEYLFFQLQLEPIYQEADNPVYLPGRCAQMIIGDKKIGWLGEVHPQVLENFEISVPTAAFEIDLNSLLEIE
jgi:phenylalanyl-tRNA synthetase beta chain